MNSMIIKGALAAAMLLLSGCASYYTHYVIFPAQNSEGEDRQVKLTWQTADYPDWWPTEDESTPITVETQCSSRTWRLVDDSHKEASEHACAPGIRACGQPGLDQFANNGKSDFRGRACLQVNPEDPDAKIVDISSSLELMVSCQPVSTSRETGDDPENVDYIRASVVPYTVHSRKGIRGRLDTKPPGLGDIVCREE